MTNKCDVCGHYEGLGIPHYVWSTIRKAHRAESYIDVLENGERYAGELEYLRGRYQAASAHEYALGECDDMR